MQGTHGELEILLIDHDGYFYFGRSDDLNVDILVGERLEHFAGDTGV